MVAPLCMGCYNTTDKLDCQCAALNTFRVSKTVRAQFWNCFVSVLLVSVRLCGQFNYNLCMHGSTVTTSGQELAGRLSDWTPCETKDPLKMLVKKLGSTLDRPRTLHVPICPVFFTKLALYSCFQYIYIHLYSPTVIAENKNLHITHIKIKRNLNKHRLHIKVTRNFYYSWFVYDLPRLKHLHNKFELILYFESTFLFQSDH